MVYAVCESRDLRDFEEFLPLSVLQYIVGPPTCCTYMQAEQKNGFVYVMYCLYLHVCGKACLDIIDRTNADPAPLLQSTV